MEKIIRTISGNDIPTEFPNTTVFYTVYVKTLNDMFVTGLNEKLSPEKFGDCKNVKICMVPSENVISMLDPDETMEKIGVKCIRKVTMIPPDAKITVLKYKGRYHFFSDKLELSSTVNDAEIWKPLLEKNGRLLYHVDPQFKTDELVLTAINQNPLSIKYAYSVTDKKNEDILTKAIELDHTTLQYININDISHYKRIGICTLALIKSSLAERKGLIQKDLHAWNYIPNKDKIKELCMIAHELGCCNEKDGRTCLFHEDYVPRWLCPGI